MPEGKFLRYMATDETREDHKQVRKVKINEFNGLYDLGWFKRWLRNRFHKAIDVRWVII